MESSRLTLTDLLAPLEPDEFLRRYWNRRFRYFPGTRGRFRELLPWPALNRILAQHRLEEPRLRLARDGAMVPSSRYLQRSAHHRHPGAMIPQLLPERLQAELRDGATLVVDGVDELHEPLTRLVEELERIFGGHVGANAYAGWGETKGFDLHWDDHDVMILQIAGRKDWKVYGTTRRCPVSGDPQGAAPPRECPSWEGTLEGGDLLYLPRGVWHVATARGEATLHLTLGFPTLTGLDLLPWLAGRLQEEELARRDLPRLEGAAAQRRYARAFQGALKQLCTPQLVTEYLAHRDAMRIPRPALGLPQAATRQTFSTTRPATRVAWRCNPGCRIVRRADGLLGLRAHGQEWHFAAAAHGVLSLLTRRGECSVGELVAGAGRKISPDQVFTLLRELLDGGLIAITK